jgi:hypothetical protein
MPDGLRAEARCCKKTCRQAASRLDLAVRRAAVARVDPSDTSATLAAPATLDLMPRSPGGPSPAGRDTSGKPPHRGSRHPPS